MTETRSGEVFDLETSALHGRHNLDNAAAAIAASRALDLTPNAIRKALAAFRPLPHRMARVATVRGTVWVTRERCDGTFTYVREGRVDVVDRKSGRRVELRAGTGYLARD